jgi:hypothetical protein
MRRKQRGSNTANAAQAAPTYAPQPGDIVFFVDTNAEQIIQSASHVGIYLGYGHDERLKATGHLYAHANHPKNEDDAGVRISKLSENPKDKLLYAFFTIADSEWRKKIIHYATKWAKEHKIRYASEERLDEAKQIAKDRLEKYPDLLKEPLALAKKALENIALYPISTDRSDAPDHNSEKAKQIVKDSSEKQANLREKPVALAKKALKNIALQANLARNPDAPAPNSDEAKQSGTDRPEKDRNFLKKTLDLAKKALEEIALYPISNDNSDVSDDPSGAHDHSSKKAKQIEKDRLKKPESLLEKRINLAKKALKMIALYLTSTDKPNASDQRSDQAMQIEKDKTTQDQDPLKKTMDLAKKALEDIILYPDSADQYHARWRLIKWHLRRNEPDGPKELQGLGKKGMRCTHFATLILQISAIETRYKTPITIPEDKSSLWPSTKHPEREGFGHPCKLFYGFHETTFQETHKEMIQTIPAPLQVEARNCHPTMLFQALSQMAETPQEQEPPTPWAINQGSLSHLKKPPETDSNHSGPGCSR